jgi:hypothetical protein
MVRLLGKVRDLQPEGHCFTLLLDDGVEVPCVLVEGDWAAVAKRKGRRTLVEGMAVWPVKGRLARVECDRVADGKGEREVWSRLPERTSVVLDLPLDAPTPRPWGIAAVIGKWPGDETEEEITRLLEEIS